MKMCIRDRVYSDLDIFRLLSERRRMSTFTSAENADYQKNAFHLETEEMKLERFFDPAPFVPVSYTHLLFRRNHHKDGGHTE